MVRQDLGYQGQRSRQSCDVPKVAHQKVSEHVSIKEYNPKNTQMQLLMNEQNEDVIPADPEELQDKYDKNLAQLKGLQKLKQKNMAMFFAPQEKKWEPVRGAARKNAQYMSARGLAVQQELHYFTPPQEPIEEARRVGIDEKGAVALKAATSGVTSETELGTFVKHQSSRNSTMHRGNGKLVIDFQALTRPGSKGGIKEEAVDERELELVTELAQTADQGCSNAKLPGSPAAKSAMSPAPPEKVVKSSVIISRQPSDRGLSDRHGSDLDLLESGYLSPKVA